MDWRERITVDPKVLVGKPVTVLRILANENIKPVAHWRHCHGHSD